MGDFKNMTESELVAKLLELCGERDILAEKLAMLNKEEECLRREYVVSHERGAEAVP